MGAVLDEDTELLSCVTTSLLSSLNIFSTTGRISKNHVSHSCLCVFSMLYQLHLSYTFIIYDDPPFLNYESGVMYKNEDYE
jgi:hypothetical protein